MTTTPDYWTMPDAELAAAYNALTARTDIPQNDNLAGALEEQFAFVEDAIMQRIGAPADADPSVSEEWLAELEEYVARWSPA